MLHMPTFRYSKPENSKRLYQLLRTSIRAASDAAALAAVLGVGDAAGLTEGAAGALCGVVEKALLTMPP